MDHRTWGLVLNSLLLCGAVCALAVPLGTLWAWLLVRTDMPGRRAGRILLGLMLLVPLYLQAAAWQAGFGLQGWYTLAYAGPVWLQGWAGAIWVHALAAIPWVVLIVGVGLQLVEPELEEQALLDAAAPVVFLRVTLRAAWPAVGLATLWAAIVTAGEMTVTDLFAVRTYAEEIYTRLAVGPQMGDTPLALLPGVALVAALVMGGLLLAAGLAPHARPGSLREPLVYQLGPWRRPLALLAAAALLLVVGVPLGNLFYKAGQQVVATSEGLLRTWSPSKCLAMIGQAPWRLRREFGWSLLIGSLAATADLLLAIPLAWIARRGGWRAVPTLLLTALCLALPGPVVGLVVIALLNRPEVPLLATLYDRSILAPWLALAIRGLPAATVVLWHALGTVPEELLESAALDGAGPFARLCRIGLRLRLAALGVAWLAALSVALGDLAASILVVPPGVITLSIHIFGLLHYGVEDQVAGGCLALIGLLAALAALAVALAARWRRKALEQGMV